MQTSYTPVAGAYVALPRVRVTLGVLEQCCASCRNWKPQSAFVSGKPGARCGTCRALGVGVTAEARP